MENLNHKILGIMGIFKTPYKISPADKQTVYLAFENLIRVLPGFFKCLEVGQPAGVSTIPLLIKGSPKYNHRYLLVLKRISDIIGIELYCKKILEGNETKPIEQIYMIGPRVEITLVSCIANYLHIMTDGITKSSRFATRGQITGKSHTMKVQVEVYMNVYNQLQKAMGYRALMTPEDGLQKRNKKVFDYIINFIKLDYNKKNNPNAPNIENARSLPGVFKHHKLL